MFTLEGFKNGLLQIRLHKLRSFLTMLGVILGVGSLICMFAIFAGIEKSMLDLVEAKGGIEKVTIKNRTPKIDGIYRRELLKGINLEDAYALKRSSGLITEVSPEYHSIAYLRYFNKRIKKSVKGVTRDALVVNNYEIGQGRFIARADIENFNSVCVIGTKIAQELFDRKKNVVGEVIEIEEIPFTVVGVIKHYEMIRGKSKKNVLQWKNETVFIPLTTMQSRVKEMEELNYIYYLAVDKENVERSSQAAARILSKRHGVEDFSIKTLAERVKKSQESLRNFGLALSFIAGISLIVGGIGILNIMLATISERVREIGLRKALGAKNRDILWQFLVESIILSVFGGILGIIVGYFGSHLFANATSWADPVLKPSATLLAFAFSVGTGIIFGLFPAIKAAKLDPIEALRYQ